MTISDKISAFLIEAQTDLTIKVRERGGSLPTITIQCVPVIEGRKFEIGLRRDLNFSDPYLSSEEWEDLLFQEYGRLKKKVSDEGGNDQLQPA